MIRSPLRIAPWFALLACALLCLACDDDTNGPAMGTPDQGSAEDIGVDAEADVGEDAGVDMEPGQDAVEDVEADAEEDAEDPEPEVGTLVIEPADLELTLTPGERREILFTASVVEEDGSLSPVTMVEWDADPPGVGQIDLRTGTWLSQGIGGDVTVTANGRGLSATTSIKVFMEQVSLGDGITNIDAAQFEEAELSADESRAPVLVYPEDGTLMPRNITGMVFQWQRGGGQLFRVRLETSTTSLTHFTRENTWEPDEDLWRLLARANIDREIRISVDATDEAGQRFSTEASSSLTLTRDVVEGAIYYWATNNAGILRLPVGEREPERFFTPTSPAGSPCVGCHALSRDGTRMAFNTAPVGIPIGPLMEVLTADPTQRIIDLDQEYNGMQPTFSPDGNRIVSGWDGTLTERDANGTCEDDMAFCMTSADCATGACITGMPIAELPDFAGFKPSFPDWAPDDRWLVAAASPGLAPLPDFEVSNSSLIIYPRPGGEWSQPRFLVEAQNNTENHYRAAFSPDSRWIAYNYSNLGSGGQQPQQQGRIDAELRMIAPNGVDHIVLDRANKEPNLSNSWPKWAPVTNGRYLWLAFSSIRNYGLNEQGVELPQIWVTAIDPLDAGNGIDPSRPAFWLPGQALDSGNHIPFWSVYEKPQVEEDQ